MELRGLGVCGAEPRLWERTLLRQFLLRTRQPSLSPFRLLVHPYYHWHEAALLAGSRRSLRPSSRAVSLHQQVTFRCHSHAEDGRPQGCAARTIRPFLDRRRWRAGQCAALTLETAVPHPVEPLQPLRCYRTVHMEGLEEDTPLCVACNYDLTRWMQLEAYYLYYTHHRRPAQHILGVGVNFFL